MNTFVMHDLLLLPKEAAVSRGRSWISRAPPFFKPLFQIVLDPPIRDMVNATGKPLFSRGVSYVLAPLAFLIFRTRQIGIGSVLFRTLKQAWTLQLQLPRETLRDRCVRWQQWSYLACRVASREWLQKGLTKWRTLKMAAVSSNTNLERTSIF
jgi:hypothetical protein